MRSAADTPEICISPGNMTGFVFDQPALVDLQDEVRFGRVLRGRGALSFMPPLDLAPGEKLRLTVHFEQDPPEQGVTFMLVSHPGQATHQVDVFHDPRSRESLWQEVEEERAENRRLTEENQSLLKQLKAPGGLLRVLLNGELGPWGIPSKEFDANVVWTSKGRLSTGGGASYRSSQSVAVQLYVRNDGTDPWTVAEVQLMGARGEQLKDIDFGPLQTILPQTTGSIFVEARAEEGTPLGGLTLTLREEGPRAITVAHIPLP